MLSHEADSLGGEPRERIETMKRRYSRVATDIVEELADGRPGIDLRVATFSLFGMMNWIYNWYRPGRDVPVEELADDISRLFLRGFLAQQDEDMPPGAVEAAPGESRPTIWRR